MLVFTTLHIACRLLHTAHTLIFARWFTTGAASITSHSPLTLYDLWVREEQLLVCRYTFISTFHNCTMYLTTGRQQRMDIDTTVSEKPASLLPTACQHERRGRWQPTLVLTCCVQQTCDHQQSSMICLSWQNVRVTVLSCEVMFISVFDSDAMYDRSYFFSAGTLLICQTSTSNTFLCAADLFAVCS